MFGYQGFIKLNNRILLGTGGTNPRNNTLLDSSSGYGGNWGTAIGNPHIYDFPTYDTSIQFDVEKSLLNDLFGWINYTSGRNTSRDLKLYPRGNEVHFPENYWTNITLSVSEASMLNSSISLLSLPPDNFSFSDNFLSNKHGIITTTEFSNLNPLNQYNNIDPIPFWKTSIIGLTSTGIVKATSWELSFEQTVEKKRICNNSSNDEPYCIGIGIVNCSLRIDVTIIGTNEQGEISLINELSSLNILIDDRTIVLNDLELQNYNESLGRDNISLSLSYNVYGQISLI